MDDYLVGILWFAAYCVAAAAFVAASIVGAVRETRSDAHVTLDCRDGVHGGCEACSCDCHAAVAA